MLLRFAIQNFRGFLERMEWNLNHPRNYDFHTHAVKDGVVRNGIIYGPNGSGKSNFSLAIFDLVNHLTQKVKKEDYYLNFVNAGNIDAPVVFEYTFRLGGQELYYKYAKDFRGKLVDELMTLDGKSFLVRNRKTIEVSGFTIADPIRKTFLESESPVSLVSYVWSNYPLPEDHVLLQLRRFVDSMLWYKCLDRREFIGLDNSVTHIEEYLVRNNLIDDFTNFLSSVSGQQFDFEVSSVDINVPNGHPTLQVRYGQEAVSVLYPFLQIASTGTQALELFYFWTKKAQKSSFIFIDEFDAFYHFDLAFKVCEYLFKSIDGQAFVSSHNTYLMTNDLLRPDCNFILSDNKIKPLVECTDKELRFAHNMEKLYRGGTFKV